MADIFSKKKRSEIMSHIKDRDTSIERIVFSYLRNQGVHFQRHYGRIPGRPDVAIPRKMKALFIDGDFWHGWGFGRSKTRLPEYWRDKISGNIARDKRNRSGLRRKGWRVMRVWEHDLKKRPEHTLSKVVRFLVD